ncbi:MAG: SAF domain-containing protein [Emergencia sp.]
MKDRVSGPFFVGKKGDGLDRGKKAVGLLLIVVSITALVTWEKWGKTRFLYDSVLVLNQDLAGGITVEEEMLEEVKMDIRIGGWIRPEEKNQIIGRQTAFFVRKGLPLFPEYFHREKLQADQREGTGILFIPSVWISSVPETIQRGNRAVFYREGRRITSAYVTSVSEEGSGFEVVVTEQQAKMLAEIADGGGTFVVTYD